MVTLSEPAQLNDIAIEMGITRGEWGDGVSSVELEIAQKH